MQDIKPDQTSVLWHCGFEDSVVNHLLLLKYAKEKKFTQEEVEKTVDKSMLSCRVFTVQSIDKMDCLVLTF